jgi:hypothetical protein
MGLNFDIWNGLCEILVDKNSYAENRDLCFLKITSPKCAENAIERAALENCRKTAFDKVLI